MSDYSPPAHVNIVKMLVGESNVVVYTKKYFLRIRDLICCSNSINNAAINPFMNTFIDWVVGRAKSASLLEGSKCEKIFLSKSKWRAGISDYRTFANEDAVGAFLEKNGFSTVYPESMPWLEQVALFSSARIVIGEFSSALHNALFTSSNSSVVGLNYVNEVQDCIAAFRGHSIDYILPTDGRRRTWRPDPGLSSDGFQISIEELDRCSTSIKAYEARTKA